MKTSCHLVLDLKNCTVSCEVVGNYYAGDQGDWMTPSSPPEFDIELLIVKSLELSDGTKIPTEWLLVRDWYDLVKNLVWDKILEDDGIYYSLIHQVEECLND
jgi:hypothetical protein